MLPNPQHPQLCRGKKIRLFLCGDYEFLCRIFGLSRASGTLMHALMISAGRHCCLWCLTRQDQFIHSPSTLGAIDFRTVKSIVEDSKKFVDAGADLRKAKLFKNCINKPFFKTFPLTQVA